MAEVTSGNLVALALTVDEAYAVSSALGFALEQGVLEWSVAESAQDVYDALGSPDDLKILE